jgi:hypothetical protein
MILFQNTWHFLYIPDERYAAVGKNPFVVADPELD